jgi:type I restriction enzyme M protein
MVRMVEPKEADTVCDPASGSGGFLIRFFEIVREQILADADRQYQQFAESIETKKLSEKTKADKLREKFDEIQKTIEQGRKDSRLWNLANRCIYGCDANDRMARTSKMNMIMHGDGHGGVHHHNGFINVNGIFEGRFDIILTNPPFGANVEPTDVVTRADVSVPDDEYERCAEVYGKAYKTAYARVKAAVGEPIASLFDLPKAEAKVRTEILFIERCLALLCPGGRLGIVLPEGVFNNPSLAHVREFCEDRAFILAVVSLPQETFFSSGASVKASLLFMQKFTAEEKTNFDKTKAEAIAEIDAKYAADIAKEIERLQADIDAAKAAKQKDLRKEAQKVLSSYIAEMRFKKEREARQLLKERFDYPVFLYQAERVGISPTGEPDQNELYPNTNQPPEVQRTCLELFEQFRGDLKPGAGA